MEKYDVDKLSDNYVNKINDIFTDFRLVISKAFQDADTDKAQKWVETFLHRMDMADDMISFGLHFDDKPDECTTRDIVQAKHAMDVWETFNELRDNKHSMAFINAVTYFVESENAAYGI